MWLLVDGGSVTGLGCFTVVSAAVAANVDSADGSDLGLGGTGSARCGTTGRGLAGTVWGVWVGEECAEAELNGDVAELLVGVVRCELAGEE